MVVDDDQDLVDALCEWIALSSDWTVVAVYGPSDAVARASADPPDAILLDMEMDGADGFDTARRIDAASGVRHPALVALTGNARLRDAASADVRFAASLLKPPNLEGLLRLLDEVSPAH
jgi:CheY-like chemotaxis protein